MNEQTMRLGGTTVNPASAWGRSIGEVSVGRQSRSPPMQSRAIRLGYLPCRGTNSVSAADWAVAAARLARRQVRRRRPLRMFAKGSALLFRP